MGDGMKFSDWAIVLATILGPIFAVQVQKWLEKWRAIRERRFWIFRSLMATRAANLNPLHVEALNAIPIDFYGRKPIIDIWEEYFAHLSNKEMAKDVWAGKRLDIFIRLLAAIGKDLKYTFNVAELHRIYFPEGHGNLEADQLAITRGLALLLSGQQPLKMSVESFPQPSADAAAQQEKLQERLIKAFPADGVIHVEMREPKQAR